MAQAATLEQLAQTDPTVAPLARLQAVALEASAQAGWAAGVPPLTFEFQDAPLLHGRTVVVVAAHQRALLIRLAAVLAEVGSADGVRLGRMFGERAFDPLPLLAASITDERQQLAASAREADADVDVLAAVGQIASLPLLLACGTQAAKTLQTVVWTQGFCPVCGAYPTLAELRGLARDRVLRCGRCAAGWTFPHDRCPYCNNGDGQALGYFAAESERESRRAVTCEVCRGYLKTATTLEPLTPDQLLIRDLETLELDVAALEAQYQRPDGLGWPLQVTHQPAAESRTGWRRGWRA